MKRTVSLLLIAAMLCALIPFSAISVFASDSIYTDSQGVEYTLSDDGAYYTVSGFNESEVNIVIASEINGIAVKKIGDAAFYWCSDLVSIVIPESVKSIGDWAFWNCSSIKSMILPDGVESVGESAFEWCSALAYIVIPKSVKSIGSSAFYNCSGLADIRVDSNNAVYSSTDGILFDKDQTELICYPAGNFEISYVIPDGVTKIGSDAFYGSSSLRSLTIPEGVTSIGWGAFAGCPNLTSVNIPNGVTTIGDFAFEGCSSLKSIVIPDSVESVGESAFAGWNGAQAVYCVAEAQPSGWDKAWAKDCKAKVVWDYKNTAFGVIVDMPEYYISEEILEVNITVENITVNKLSYIEFSVFYDANELKLLNGRNKDGSLNFVSAIPEGWENLTSFEKSGDGEIKVVLMVTELKSFPEKDGDITLTLRFELIGSADSDISVYIPDESVNGSDWDNPATAFEGSGSSASSACHLHDYEVISVDSEQHKYVCACGYIVYEAHNFETTTVIDPTCGQGGYTVMNCKECGEELICDHTDELGHDYKDAITEPTCTEQGYTTHTCARCGDSYIDTYTDALGHDYKDAVTAPTCTERGYTTHTCARCGDSYVDTYTDALGHKPGDWEIVKEPANGEDGLQEKHCTVCGKTVESEVIPGYIKGDVNGNGTIDALDYGLAKRSVLGTYTLTEDMLKRGDLDGNGEITAIEYGLIKRHVLGTYTIV